VSSVLLTQPHASPARHVAAWLPDRDAVTEVVERVGLVVETIGVAVIVVSVLAGLGLFAARLVRRQTRSRAYIDARRCLGRGVLLGLELLVAGDIVRTVAVTPTLTSVGVLALIVLIRTFLSFALEVELNGRWPWQSGSEHPGSAQGSPSTGR
jgi:uncharacterized membrane protein